MKLFALLTVVLASQMASAETIQFSTYEPEHQAVIIQAIAKHCSVPATALSQVSSVEKLIHVDNGITDIQYVTEIRSREYVVTVESFYADFQNPTAGSNYSVTAVHSPYCD